MVAEDLGDSKVGYFRCALRYLGRGTSGQERIAVKLLLSIVLIILAAPLSGCDFMDSPVRVQPDPRLFDAGADPSLEPCGTGRCAESEVCAGNAGGQTCVERCDPLAPGPCPDGQRCVDLAEGNAGCFKICGVLEELVCPVGEGCLSVAGTDGICVTRGDQGDGQACTQTPECLDNLVCSGHQCLRPCAEGEDASCPAGLSCRDVADGIGVCNR